MHRLCSGIAGIILAAAFAGCGDTSVDEGVKPFKSTDTSQFDTMKEQSSKVLKNREYTKRPVPPKEDEKK